MVNILKYVSVALCWFMILVTGYQYWTFGPDRFGLFWSPEIEGVVLDEETHEPIEGVVVTATWIMRGPFISNIDETLEALEAVTDKDGKYKIRRWGPKYRFFRYIRDDEPKVRFFKPGYYPLTIGNNTAYHPGYEDDLEHMIKSERKDFTGRVTTVYTEPDEHMVDFGYRENAFYLERFGGNAREYVYFLRYEHNHYYTYMFDIDYIRRGKHCEWKKLPLTLMALHDYAGKIEREINARWFTAWNVGNQSKCGDARELLSADNK